MARYYPSFEIYGSVATAVDEPKLRAGTVVEDILRYQSVALIVTSLVYYRLFSILEPLVMGNMEAAGTAAWTVYQSILSKSLVNPHGGLQSLQVAFNAYGSRCGTSDRHDSWPNIPPDRVGAW